MQDKKILILSFYYTPDLCAGSFRTAALIEALQARAKKNDVSIHLITTMPNRYHHFKMQAKAHEELDHLTIDRIELPDHHSGFIDQAKAFARYFFTTRCLIKNKKYDCVFATSSRLLTAFLGAIISRKQNCPLFLDMRDIFTETMESILPTYLKKILLPIFNLIERYTLKRAARLNLVSPGFTEYFSSKINPQCKILQISNGVDACFNNLNLQVSILNHPIRVLYAGNIGEGQGIEKIIPTFAEKTKELCIIRIIGSGGKLNALRAACENNCSIALIEPMSRSELMMEYQKSDILFLHLNNYDAFLKVLPSKIFEYAMMGKPILAGVAGYSAAFLKQHVPWAHVFLPCNASDAFKKLNEIINNHDAVSSKDTTNFYQQFNRETLMNQLANEIMTCTQNEKKAHDFSEQSLRDEINS